MVSNDIYSALIRRVQVNHVTLIWATMSRLIFVDQIDDRRRFPGTRRTLKEQIREILFLEYVLEEFSVNRI